MNYKRRKPRQQVRHGGMRPGRMGNHHPGYYTRPPAPQPDDRPDPPLGGDPDLVAIPAEYGGGFYDVVLRECFE